MATKEEGEVMLLLAEPKGPAGAGYGATKADELRARTGLAREVFADVLRELERDGYVSVEEIQGGIDDVWLTAHGREWVHLLDEGVPSPREDGEEVGVLVAERGSVSVADIAKEKGWCIERAEDAARSACAADRATWVSRRPLYVGGHRIAAIDSSRD